MASNGPERIGRKCQTLLLALHRKLLQEILGQKIDIVSAIAQRRQLEDDHGQPEVQVLPEFSVRHRLFEIGVGGGDHPGIDLDFLPAADPLKALFLQKAEQLDLNRGWKFADLVQEQSAAAGTFDQPLALSMSAGKGALFVAE